MKNVFYEGYNGSVYERDELEKAFYLATGISAKNEAAFMKWLNVVFGKSIKRAFRGTPRELFNMGYRVKAIKLYRDENECSLVDAKKIVDSWEEVSK